MVEPTGTAFIFPGQGAQAVGMGRDLFENFAAAKVVFQLADEVTGFSLTKLCFEGPEAELLQTINTQPAILTVSLACLKAIEEASGGKLPVPAFVAGHSLGEYTALAVSGAIDYGPAIYLTRQRGRLMYEAGLQNKGGMAAVLGLDEAVLQEVCRETDTIIANYNCPGQFVISGAESNIARASELAKAKGAARVRALQVSGAFHSPLMKPAADGLSEIITKTEFKSPNIPVIANVTAQPVATMEQIKTELVTQLCTGVQWQRSVEYMVNQGVKTFIEIGPGKVLTGLNKRINADIINININDVTSIKEFLKI
jgi:[acyl-carrier-protein] S-malonyltransferase